jgi:hypothetical protein
MRRANAALVTVTALLSTVFLAHTAAVWDRLLPPYPHTDLTPGQAAYIGRQIAVSRPLFLGAAVAWLATIGVAVARRLGRPTSKSALAALATLAALLTLVTAVYDVAIEVGSSQPYPYPALTPEQAAYRRYHLAVINALVWAVLIAWLLTGVALLVWLLSLAARRVRGPAGSIDAMEFDRSAGAGEPPREGTEESPGADSPFPPPPQGRPAGRGAADLPARPGRFVRGFAALHWWLSLAWLWLAERGILSGLSRLRDLGDEAYVRQYANPHLYARSETIQATAEIISGSILRAMAVAGLVLVSGLRRGRAWSRWLALGQSAWLLPAGGVIALSLVSAKSWKTGDAG